MAIEIKSYEIELDKLKPTEKNPRQISKEDFEILKKSLQEFPEMREIREVVVDENLRILGGHMRVRALLDLGEKAVPIKQVFGLTEKQKDEFVIKDNIANGDWDMDIIANEWDSEELAEWGLEDIEKLIDTDEIIEVASENTIKEFDDDTNYDLKKLYREKVSEEIEKRIEKGIASGSIRPEIADVLRTRAKQCSIFNFDEIIKFYRSKDASEVEKELLRRLYLVFVAPKELFEKAILKITSTTSEVYDDELTRKVN